ncbi:MAG: toprim domain-containing protein [Candidatus Woesearchaeota archaeon]
MKEHNKISYKNNRKIIEKEEIINEIEKIKTEDLLIIVEGKKDKKSLINLGIKENNILTIKKDIFSFTQEINIKLLKKKEKNKKEIVILTDLDKEGKKLYSKIKENIEKEHIKVNNKLREMLLKSELKQIEGLNSYLKEIENLEYNDNLLKL